MTAQTPELLLLDGVRRDMTYCPPLPDREPRIVTVEAEVGSPLNSTACLRGYRGSWELRDGRLYLAKLEGSRRLLAEEPIFADWVTGTLRLPEGEELRYVHLGFATVFERELEIDIEQGCEIGRRLIDHGDSSQGMD